MNSAGCSRLGLIPGEVGISGNKLYKSFYMFKLLKKYFIIQNTSLLTSNRHNSFLTFLSKLTNQRGDDSIGE
jgi:hypothetical protein